ncbi:MAG TPA: CapA family protein [Bryobacteraceae bacterium]|nr:CapA family protein [Bryobacteraceae bacterium]
MPTAQSVLILGCLAVALPLAAQDDNELRLLFTGDILLSRQVRHEIDRTGRFPWDGLSGLFHQATWVAGNLEGAVGKPEDCIPAASSSPCFDIPPALVPLLKRAGFSALGIANNHSNDLGPAGLLATTKTLRQQGLQSLSFSNSPRFLNLSGHTIAIVAVSSVAGRDGSRTEIPSVDLRQKLRLARTLSELVVVFVHWGSELLDWPSLDQRQAAEWLIQNGAGLIIGHHPHVVQSPQCVLGKPVFYSLGNHLFDQKYPATKEGSIADCRIRDNLLRCGVIRTLTPAGTSFPQIAQSAGNASEPCAAELSPLPSPNGVTLRGRVLDTEEDRNHYLIEGGQPGGRTWRSVEMSLLSTEVGRLAGPGGFRTALHPGATLFVHRRRGRCASLCI